ncbi:MAG: hypothetical protein ACXVRJ_12745 [Gaiellaceae bacterium]
MSLARVVEFEGVDRNRVEEMLKDMEGGERPPEIPAAEFVMLHDPQGEKMLVVFFFDNESDYDQADAALNAMPAGDTPGRRTAVTRYDVAARITG